jgi:tetratricopeptide (TPR) repeat protein
MQVKDQKLEQILGYARSWANDGMVAVALGELKEAQEYAAKVGIEIPEATLKEIEETAYRSGVEAALGYARSWANDGMVAVALGELKEAQEYAAKVGIDISDRVREIEAGLKK